MSDIFSQLFPEPAQSVQQPIVTLDTPYLEDDAEKRRLRAENIAMITAYGQNISLYREQEQRGEGVRQYS